jgi:prolipoprotein diacylglyceryl transferase
LYDPGYYFLHPLEIWLPIKAAADGGYEYIGYQGLASHGGIAGLILALVTYARRTGESVLNTVDLISIVAPLGGCFIRLGNLMNSEILGFPTSVPWAFVFEREDQLPRHPAQLYEAIMYLLIFLSMYYLYVNYRPRLKNGFFFGTGMALVFTSRFLIEFLKERQVAFESQMALDMGQWLSIPFVLAGIGFVPCAPCVAPIFSVSQVLVYFKASTGAAPFMTTAVNDDTFHACCKAHINGLNVSFRAERRLQINGVKFAEVFVK